MYQTTMLNAGEFCSICNNGMSYIRILYQQKFNIPLIIAGISSRVDEASPYEINCSSPKYVRNVLQKGLTETEINDFLLPRLTDLSPFELIKRKLTKTDYVGINLPDHVEWNNEEIQDVLIKEMKYKTPDKKKDHIDCRYADVKYYIKNQQIPGFIYIQEKFSQLIRDGQLSREEAIKRHKTLIKEEKIPAELDNFLETLDLQKSDIENIKNRTHLDFITKEKLESK